MNILFTLQGIDFEWDTKKAETNFNKHGIEFESAAQVFLDPFVTALEDELVDGEYRETAVGLTTDWKLLYMVYTIRGDRIRIISARPVTQIERRRYED